MNFRRLIHLLLILTISTIVFGCSSGSSNTGEAGTKTMLDNARDRGYFKVAVSSEGAPFGFINEDNEHVGFDLDLAKLINEVTFGENSEVELVDTSFDGRWEAVNNQQVDFGVMLTTIYPERALNVAFTDGYIKTGNAALVHKDSGIDTIADLNDPDVTVAILNVPEAQDRHKRVYPEGKTQTFDSTATQITALKSGQVDVAGVDLPAAQNAAAEDSSLKVLPELIDQPANNAIFMKPGDFESWLYLNTLIQEMKEGHLKPRYDEIYEKWFGELPDNN